MKNRITKQVKQELKSLIDTKGYWSEEVRDYLAQFDYYRTGERLHNMAHNYYYRNEGSLKDA